MFWKSKDNYQKIRNKIVSNLNSGKFENALADYYKLEEEFEKLTEKETFKQEFDNITNELLLYVNLNDGFKYCGIESLGDLRERIGKIDNIMHEINVISNALNSYFNQKYGFINLVYKKRLVLREFEDKYDEIKKLADESNYDFALKKLMELVHLKLNLEELTQSKNQELDDRIETLKKELQLGYLELRAYSDVAKQSTRKKKKVKKLPELGRRLPSLPERVDERHENIKKLPKLLNEGSLEEAARILNEI